MNEKFHRYFTKSKLNVFPLLSPQISCNKVSIFRPELKPQPTYEQRKLLKHLGEPSSAISMLLVVCSGPERANCSGSSHCHVKWRLVASSRPLCVELLISSAAPVVNVSANFCRPVERGEGSCVGMCSWRHLASQSACCSASNVG